jgi:hypothetical protein
VVIAIIGIMAALGLGVMRAAREASAQAATKATIAKLNAIVMERYEGYLTRRVGFDCSGLTADQIAAKDAAARSNPNAAARYRLDCIRDTMRMEMPDAKSDIINGPVAFPWGRAPEPAIHKLYAQSPPTSDHDSAQCLYLMVSRLMPEAMEQFSQNELGTIDGKPCFVDGWGRPIMWLRWAPGFSNCPAIGLTGPSNLQSGVAVGTEVDINADVGIASWKPLILPDGSISTTKKLLVEDHDPFDSCRVDGFAFHLVPLIYSAGPDGEYGLAIGATGPYNGDPYGDGKCGSPMAEKPDAHLDNVTNHLIETR